MTLSSEALITIVGIIVTLPPSLLVLWTVRKRLRNKVLERKRRGTCVICLEGPPQMVTSVNEPPFFFSSRSESDDRSASDSPVEPMAQNYQVTISVSLSDSSLETGGRRLSRARCMCKYSCLSYGVANGWKGLDCFLWLAKFLVQKEVKGWLPLLFTFNILSVAILVCFSTYIVTDKMMWWFMRHLVMISLRLIERGFHTGGRVRDIVLSVMKRTADKATACWQKLGLGTP